MSNCGCEVEIKNREERGILYILLSINGVMFIVELIAGWIAESTGLIADSLDMLADALVYTTALYAVGKGLKEKANSAYLNGRLQLILGASVLIDIVRRAIYGSEPESLFMITVSMVALAANVSCLLLLSKHREGEVHMRATWICSRSDVIANMGVIAAGVLVAFTGSRVPDLIIGCIISAIVTKGGIDIIREAKEARVAATGSNA
ncbi:MAG: cation transporter [Deltaproteobacteria bacterium]|nr:cation transporter [Deltaproteobacteria bacterium]